MIIDRIVIRQSVLQTVTDCYSSRSWELGGGNWKLETDCAFDDTPYRCSNGKWEQLKSIKERMAIKLNANRKHKFQIANGKWQMANAANGLKICLAIRNQLSHIK